MSETFGGQTFSPARDGKRLAAQFDAVREVMLEKQWRTLTELQTLVSDRYGIVASLPAISARVRDLRKLKFGGYHVERDYVGAGLWRYRVAP